jgi:hypothetical protein
MKYSFLTWRLMDDCGANDNVGSDNYSSVQRTEQLEVIRELIRAWNSSRMSNPQSAQLVTHLLTQTASTLALLESLCVISAEDAQVIKSRLPNAYGPFPSLEPAAIAAPAPVQSPIPSLPPRGEKPPDVGMGQLTVRDPPPPPMQLQGNNNTPHARALWDYRGNVWPSASTSLITKEPDDLAFASGEILVIDEHGKPR